MGPRTTTAVRALVAVAMVAAVLGGPWWAGAAGADEGGVEAMRAAGGLPALAHQPALDEAARRHAADMAAAGAVSHLDLTPLQGALDRPGRLGQVVGTGATLQEITATFEASELHRGVIMGDFELVGIGVATGADGRLWLAAIFAKPLPAAVVVAPVVATAARPAAAAPAHKRVVRRAPARVRRVRVPVRRR